MNFDNAILWLATRNARSFKECKEAGIADWLLVGAHRRAWAFVVRYVADNPGVIPPLSLIKDDSGIEVVPVEDGVTIRYVAEKLFERKQFGILQHHVVETGKILERGDQKAALERTLGDAEKLRRLRTAGLRVHTLADTVRDVQDQYRRVAAGARGIEFPWESLNQITFGMHPGTLTFWVARPSTGKTWAAAISAVFAWLKGHRVLIVSPEMDRVELAERIVSYHGRFNYSSLISGMLGAYAEPKFDEEIEFLADPVRSFADRFFILDDDVMMSPTAIEEAVDAVEPDVLYVDSTYMLRVVDDERFRKYFGKGDKKERVDAVAEWLRSNGRRRRIATAAVSQLSREAKKIKKKSQRKVKEGVSTGGLEDTLAFTDVILQHSHNVFALMRDDDMALNKQMAVVILKVRRPIKMTRTVMLNWNMDTMDFSEIGPETEPQFEDRGYDDVEPF